MKILIVGDPIGSLKIKGDSSLVLLEKAMGRGHEVFWALGDGISYNEKQVGVKGWKILKARPGNLPENSSATKDFPLREMDVIFIRKDPPFDQNYMKLCWLLCLEEPNVWMMNRPSLLLRYHEKMIPFEAYAANFLSERNLIPTFIGASQFASKYFKSHPSKWVVTKPFLGYGGKEVERFPLEKYSELLTDQSGSLVQPFMDDIVLKGDRRVFFLRGKYLGGFVRRPAEGGFISNLARGGTAESVPLDPGQEDLFARLGSFLRETGIALAGADIIGSRVSEVNITSPTGLRHLEYLEGNNRGDVIMDFVEQEFEKFRKRRTNPSRKGK